VFDNIVINWIAINMPLFNSYRLGVFDGVIGNVCVPHRIFPSLNYLDAGDMRGHRPPKSFCWFDLESEPFTKEAGFNIDPRLRAARK